jgi:SBF-like CPA transporter family (DUF4137)
MAGVLFAGQGVGLLVLPLMLFHQIQLMVCAWLAVRYARTADSALGGPAGAARRDRVGARPVADVHPRRADESEGDERLAWTATSG